MGIEVQQSRVRGSAASLLLAGYRRSRVLPWLRGLALRRHWRELHTRNSCIYGINIRPFLRDLVGILAGMRTCDGQIVEYLESTLASILGATHVVSFSSGRNSLRAILKAMGIGEGDEVILPAFTCVVVPFAILHCGGRPVYVDIRHDYRMNLDALRASLTARTKAIIAQHTFGFPERMSEIVMLARARGIRVIEDCAHVLPGSAHDGKALGTWGDAAYFSFEGAKTISSISGGAAVTSDEGIGQQLRQIKDGVAPLSRTDNLRIGSRLLLSLLLYHPDLYALGELIREWLFRRGVFEKAVPAGECRGDPPKPLLGRLADIQASLLLCQLRELSSISERRRSCVRALAERLGGSRTDFPLMWYPLKESNPEEAVGHFRSRQIELRTWGAPLSPANCDVRAGYQWGSCPVAEEIGRSCVALPTMLAGADLERVIAVASLHLGTARIQSTTLRQGTVEDSYAVFTVFRQSSMDLGRRLGGVPISDGEDPQVLARLWEQRRPLFEHLARTADRFWVAEDKARTVGYARSILRDGIRQLTEYFVLPGYQSAGLGQELLTRAFPADGARHRAIIASIDSRALARYLKTGVFARFPIYYFSGPAKEAVVPSDLTVEPLAESPEAFETLAGLDQVLLGHRRDVDHAWLMRERRGFLYRKSGQPAGYGYAGGPTSGPFALLDEADFPAALAHAEAEALRAGTGFGVKVPLINRAAVEYLLARGYRMSELTLFMSDSPFGAFEHYIFPGSTFCL